MQTCPCTAAQHADSSRATLSKMRPWWSIEMFVWSWVTKHVQNKRYMSYNVIAIYILCAVQKDIGKSNALLFSPLYSLKHSLLHHTIILCHILHLPWNHTILYIYSNRPQPQGPQQQAINLLMMSPLIWTRVCINLTTLPCSVGSHSSGDTETWINESNGGSVILPFPLHHLYCLLKCVTKRLTWKIGRIIVRTKRNTGLIYIS